MKRIKFTPYFFIIIFILLTISCKSDSVSDKEIILVEQLNTDYPITFFKNNENNKMVRIFFRIPFQISSNMTDNKTITSLSYYYSKKFGKPYLTVITTGWSSNILLYNRKDNQRILRSKDMTDRKFNKENPIYIYIETQHDVDTTAQVQSELKPYIDKMVELGQDTMSIPSFKEFKKQHPQLVKDLLQGDSISVFIKEDLLKRDNQKGDTIINIPIKY